MSDPITLDITSDGQITWSGQPFLWAAFFPKSVAETKPVEVMATQILHPFTFNGATYQGMDWLLRHTDGSFTAVANADYQAQYAPKV
jgi:hypothetical protein